MCKLNRLAIFVFEHAALLQKRGEHLYGMLGAKAEGLKGPFAEDLKRL